MARARGPRHSLAYLQFLAAKRKPVSGQENGGDVDEEMEGVSSNNGNGVADVAGNRPPKRARTSAPAFAQPLTVTETLQHIWKEMAAAESKS